MQRATGSRHIPVWRAAQGVGLEGNGILRAAESKGPWDEGIVEGVIGQRWSCEEGLPFRRGRLWASAVALLTALVIGGWNVDQAATTVRILAR
jgi:hypothetical protein